MSNVLLAVPCGGSVKSKTMASVIAALSHAPGATFDMIEGALGPENRTALAHDAIQGGFSHLWLVDADMKFAPDTLGRLLAHDKDIVGAAYNYRGLPVRTTVKIEDAAGTVGMPTGALPDRLFQCYAIGSGCKLVKVSALRRIPQPWFALDFNADGSLRTSDDVWFCRQARAAGIETWCDPTLDVQHIGDFEY